MESYHEGVRYPCDKGEYAATETGSLKGLFESYHEGVGSRTRICSWNVVSEFKRTNTAIQQTCDFTDDFKSSSFK